MSVDLIRKYYIDENKSLFEIKQLLNMPMSELKTIALKNDILLHNLQKFCTQNIGKKLFIFDLETTGLPITRGFNKFYHYSESKYYDSSRIIQLAYSTITLGEISEKEIISFYRYPEDNLQISENSFKIHKIDIDYLEKYGVPFNKMISSGVIDAMNECDFIISHNIQFDFNVFCNELYRINYVIPENWHNKLICTCKLTEFTKLETLYRHLFANSAPEQGFHNASGDVQCIINIMQLIL